MYTAVGTTFVAQDTGRMLLNLRSNDVSYPHTWSFWGGKIEKGEQPLDALRRELKEEMGQRESKSPKDLEKSLNLEYNTRSRKIK